MRQFTIVPAQQSGYNIVGPLYEVDDSGEITDKVTDMWRRPVVAWCIVT